jgi:sporadic carbohydrate cluster protein (TIGR04323 family)
MGAASQQQSASRFGYRGYVASRAVRGTNFPQHVQNLVVRDYAARHGLHYLLSVTEYAMPSCYLMLNALLDELPRLEGTVFFSLFMLPRAKARRLEIFERVLARGCELHAALENVALRRRDDIAALEDVLQVAFTLPLLPLAGRYEKDENSREERARDPFWSVLERSL